jgi:UTP:GlnB (protein PII) uridylyltransferase
MTVMDLSNYSNYEMDVEGEAAPPAKPEPSLEAIIYAWLKRLPANLQPVLDYQLQNLPARYFASLDVNGVQTDFNLMDRLRDERVIVMPSEVGGRTTMRVLMAQDEPRIFLRVVAALAAHQIGIERALIFTGSKDNMVIDHFVLGRIPGPAQLARAVARVRDSLLSGICETPELFKPIHSGLRVQVENHNSQDHTTLTVFACDQMGFLFRIARVFSDLRLQIHFANLNTHGGQIVDSFHLVSHAGARLSLHDEIELRDAIHAAFAP